MSNRAELARLALKIAEGLSDLQDVADAGNLDGLLRSLMLVEHEARDTAIRLMPLRVIEGGAAAARMVVPDDVQWDEQSA